jgi:hypothetical protein
MADSSFMQGDPDKGAISVPFSDDQSEAAANDNAVVEEEDKPGEHPEVRKARRQRRNERLQEQLRLGKRALDEVEALKERDAQRDRELAELRGMVAANQNARQQPPSDGKSDWDRRLDTVYERQRNAYAAAQAEIKAGTFDDKRQQHYDREAREIEAEKARIHAEQVLESREQYRRAEQAQQVWVQKYPEVYGNQQAYQYAEATFRRRQALGEAVSNQLVEEVMQEAMTQFRLGPKKAPSASDRARLSGIASSGTGQSTGRTDTGIQMTPELRRMAIAAYSDLPEAEALKKWANGPGKRLRDRKVL